MLIVQKAPRVSSVGERDYCTSFVKHLSVTVICANTQLLFPAFYFFQPSSGAVVIFTSRLIIEDLSKERMLPEHHHQHSTKIY